MSMLNVLYLIITLLHNAFKYISLETGIPYKNPVTFSLAILQFCKMICGPNSKTSSYYTVQ